MCSRTTNLVCRFYLQSSLRALATIPLCITHGTEAGNSKILVNCVLFWLVLQYMTASTLDYHHVHLLHPRRSFLSLEFLHPFSLEL